ncbi:GNAT family N-acetyltransferase [Alkalihalobacillus sp. 1P02AB]|uniref:GNAT family N-acetyltransferase n=1 Tax=Alkalihalobacillus sp. 1P02AB TaxID=3132260 RepID=UPI0039A4DB9A
MRELQNVAVQLVPVRTEHIDGIYKAAHDSRIWKHMSVDLMEKENVIQYVNDALQRKGKDFAFVIVNNSSKEIIGVTWFLDYSAANKSVEIGSTWLNPTYWRSTINTNCKYLLLKYCFEELKLNRVQIKTGHENIRSQKAIERIGATKEGILRNHMIRKEGKIRHTVMYSIIIEEWVEIKRHFEENLLQD